MDGDLFAAAEVLPPADVAIFCAEHAEAIRVLGRRVVGDIIEIGNRLIDVRKALPGGFLAWLKREFGWSSATAYNFISVAEAFGDELLPGRTLNFDARALYLLAGPTVPAAVREEAVERAEAGERITKAEAERLVLVASHSMLTAEPNGVID